MGLTKHRVKIAGLGSYLPPRVVMTTDLERQWGTPANRIFRVTGVAERRYEPAKTVSEMAAAAARQAMTAAEISAGDIDTIIAASAVAQQAIPCTAAIIQRELGGGEGPFCFDVNATCLSFVAGLHVASLMLSAGEANRVLICSSEKASQSLDPDHWESAGLFGDGAAAAVVTRAGPDETSAVQACRFETHSSGGHLASVPGGGTFRHPNDPATTRRDNVFQMDGPGILRFTAERFDRFLQEFLADTGRGPADYDLVVPHQASRSALMLLTSRYGFREDQIVRNLQHRGNCVAASIPTALADAVASGRVRRGHRILLLCTAAGISLGAMELVY